MGDSDLSVMEAHRPISMLALWPPNMMLITVTQNTVITLNERVMQTAEIIKKRASQTESEGSRIRNQRVSAVKPLQKTAAARSSSPGAVR